MRAADCGKIPLPLTLALGSHRRFCLDENAVINVMCRHFEQNGYTVEQRLHTTQRGIDIIARDKSGRRIYIEAKGATSSVRGSARYEVGFNSNQVFDRVAKALYTGLCMRAEHPDRSKEDVGLAFPDTAEFRKRHEPIRQQVVDAGLHVFHAGPDGRLFG